MSTKPKRIGITGGIGSGKSEVTIFLRSLGYSVIDADEVAREAAAPGEPAMISLHEEIGGDIILEDGSLDRRKLAKLMFADPVILAMVNEIFHGDIRERIEKRAEAYAEQGEKLIFISAALLLESEGDWMTDEVWLVTADEETRLRRVMERDGLTEEDVRARMRNQMPEAEKRKRADVVIENNGTPAEIKEKLIKILQNQHNL